MKDALVSALADARGLLTGPGCPARRKSLFVLAAMAGVVGVGAAPPPLGLLQPVWAEPSLHSATFDNPVIVAGLGLLAVFLVLMGGFARSFTLAFAEGIVSGRPMVGRYKAWLRRGAAHFVWSSALTLPLYAVLFIAEAVVTQDTAKQLTALVSDPNGTEAQLMVLLGTAVFKFLLVLIPWTLVTLPAMVTIYELTPVAMVTSGKGPLGAARLVREIATKAPRCLLGYLGVRFVLQLAGNTLALVALVPSVVVSSPVVVPLVLGSWYASAALGGTVTGGGAAVLTVGVLMAAVALYCVLCAALLPVSVFLFAFANRIGGGAAAQGA